MAKEHYREFLIEEGEHGWDYAHEEYTGDEDSRCGTAPTLDSAKREID